jgi:hypothetical protein
VLQKCAKNAQIETTPPKTCHNGRYVVASKKIVTLNLENQNNTLIKIGINYALYVSLLEGDGIPLTLLYCTDATFASWVCCCINIS